MTKITATDRLPEAERAVGDPEFWRQAREMRRTAMPEHMDSPLA